MKRKIEIATVPGLGSVTAEIRYRIQADGTEVDRTLGLVRYADGQVVEDEHRSVVGEFMRAYAG